MCYLSGLVKMSSLLSMLNDYQRMLSDYIKSQDEAIDKRDRLKAARSALSDLLQELIAQQSSAQVTLEADHQWKGSRRDTFNNGAGEQIVTGFSEAKAAAENSIAQLEMEINQASDQVNWFYEQIKDTKNAISRVKQRIAEEKARREREKQEKLRQQQE